MPIFVNGSPDGARPLLREGLLTVRAALMVVLFALVLLLHDPHAFWRDDYQTYHLAGYCDMARAWHEGEFPLLSPYTWMCGALAAEYQCGVFSAFLHPLVIVAFGLGLSLPLTAAVLSVTHLAVLAAGAFRLARFRGLGTDAALLLALVAALHGYTIVWGARIWFPALATFAWVPWFWWGLERTQAPGAAGPARFLPAGVFLYLVLTGGWPFTVLMCGLLSVWLILKTCWEQQRVGVVWPVAAAWGLGLALSSPAWLMLVEYSPYTLRQQLPADATTQFRVPVSGLWGLIFPAWVAEWNIFQIAKPHQNVELAGGLVPVVALFAACRLAGRPFLRRHAWDLALVVLTLTLVLLPGFGPFRWSVRWLPLFFLAVALAAGHALAELRGRPVNLGVWCTCFVVPVGFLAWAGGVEPAEQVAGQAVGLTLLAIAWAVVERGSPSSVARQWAPCVVVLISCWLAYRDVGRVLEVAGWPLDESIRAAAPLDPERRYLNVHGQLDMLDVGTPAVTSWAWGKGTGLRPGNAWLYAGVHTVNGYSPMIPAYLDDVLCFVSHAPVRREDLDLVLRQWPASGGFLDFLGVNGIVVADQYVPQARGLEDLGWQQAAQVDGGMVYHRGDALAPRWRSVARAVLAENQETARRRLRGESGPHTPVLVRAAGDAVSIREFALADVELVRDGRNAVEVTVANLSPEREALLVFLRPWFPGNRARLNGQAVPVERADLILPAVRLPAGARGQLVLEYRPTTLLVGCWLAGGALVMMGILLLFQWLRLRRGKAV